MKNVGDVFTDEDGQDWKVVRVVDAENFFASRLHSNGKNFRGRPSKFQDIVNSVETEPVTEKMDELQLELEIK